VLMIHLAAFLPEEAVYPTWIKRTGLFSIPAETKWTLYIVMKCRVAGFSEVLGSVCFLVLCSTVLAQTQQPQPRPRPREFPPGTLSRLEDLPAGRFPRRIDGLPVQARQRALARLRSFHFTEMDLESLDADAEGDI